MRADFILGMPAGMRQIKVFGAVGLSLIFGIIQKNVRL